MDRETRSDARALRRGERKPAHPPQLFWPLLLIAAGVLLLLTNLGLLTGPAWGVLWRLWPLLLIALGVEVWVGRRSVAGALVSAFVLLALLALALVLALSAERLPALRPLTEGPEWQTSRIEHPLAGVERATVEIHWSNVPGYLAALSSFDHEHLLTGEVDYVGELDFTVTAQEGHAQVWLASQSDLWAWPWQFGGGPQRWDVRLSPHIPLALVVDASSGPCTLDLRDLWVEQLTLDASSGRIDLLLPAQHSIEATIEGSSGMLEIRLPPGVGARVELEAGSGGFFPSERFRLVAGEMDGDGIWETADYATAAVRARLMIDQSSGMIVIR